MAAEVCLNSIASIACMSPIQNINLVEVAVAYAVSTMC